MKLGRELNEVYCCDCKKFLYDLDNADVRADLLYADILYDAPDFDAIDLMACTVKSGGALFIQTDYRSVAEVKIFLDGTNGLDFENWIIWPYDWGGRPKDAFGRKHDDILYYVKRGGKKTFNAKSVAIPKVALINSKKDWKIPTDVWSDIGNFYTTSKERIKDDNGKGIVWQKPERLLERIVLACSNKGDLVVDPMCGTGTTLAVAKKLRRRFLGCDNNKKIVGVAKKRLDAIPIST